MGVHRNQSWLPKQGHPRVTSDAWAPRQAVRLCRPRQGEVTPSGCLGLNQAPWSLAGATVSSLGCVPAHVQLRPWGTSGTLPPPPSPPPSELADLLS